MNFMGFRYCPYCESDIEGGEVYIREGQLIGCENCISREWADFEEEDGSEEGDFDYHSHKEEAVCERQEALLRGCI